MSFRTNVGLFAGEKSNGQEVFEEVPAEDLGGGKLRIISSPGFVAGLAAGDVISLDSSRRGRFEVIKRGGNLCIQIYGDSVTDDVDARYSSRFEELGGRMDDKGPQVIVYTIPVSAGFPVIESMMKEIIEAFPGVDWCYGNVYDPVDGETPLNWWGLSVPGTT